MDTNIGIVQLTDIQRKNLGYVIKPEPFKGFSVWEDGTVIGVSDIEPNQDQITTALDTLTHISTEPVKGLLEDSFSFHILMGRLNQELSPMSLIKLSPYSGALESFCSWKNFGGIKDFLDGLLAMSILTAEELTVVSDCFSEQGIDLADYE